MHSTSVRCAVTNFQMPAMSPTMTEGAIASWKVAEGDSFEAGDVLLEIVRVAHTLPRSRVLLNPFSLLGNGQGNH